MYRHSLLFFFYITIIIVVTSICMKRCHLQYSGYEGPWSKTPTEFSNAYYILLKRVKWTVNKDMPNLQYQNKKGDLMMLPSDLVLIEDEHFKKWVDIYAEDQDLFFSDFAKIFQKLQEIGCKDLYNPGMH